jgi:hypothetical protein
MTPQEALAGAWLDAMSSEHNAGCLNQSPEMDCPVGAEVRDFTPKVLAALTASGYSIVPIAEVERLRRVWEAARLVSQWHGAIGSGPIEVLDAELGELRAALEKAP